ncbi:MAG: SusC/RagA family TonB-linked outer membrane protein [Niabella sp.]|nr:SusC/RagA family TonB-linked outer membrane protein [Niabella sp.]
MRKIVLLLALVTCSLLVFAQTKLITGSVKDESGNPISFATVLEKGTKKAISADAQGNFTMNAKEGATLEVSATGYQSQTVQASGSPINVTLKAGQGQTIEEVVVTTALGIKRNPKELGYAATSLSSKTVNQAKSVNIQQALNGKVSGVNISTTNSGVFENAKINIRGIRSLTGNNQPMLVVDGAPTPLGYLSQIPPSDVQDVTVLKSAASAAIYGPDAVNGVIVVTTKRGSNKLNVSFTSSLQAARVAFYPKLQHQFGAGGGEESDQYGNYTYIPYENQQYGPAFDGSTQQIGKVLEDGSVQTGPYSPLYVKDNKNFWNTGLTFQNSLSVSDKNFYFSVDDANIKGLMPDDKNRRTSFRFNGALSSANEKFKINYGLNYVLQNYNVVNEAGFSGLFPSAYNGSIFFLIMQTPSNVNIQSYKDWQHNKFAQYSNYYNEFAANPYWVIGNLRQIGREDDLLGNLNLSYQFTDWLKANISANTTLGFNNYQNNTAPVTVTDWAHANRSSTMYTNQPGSTFSDQAYNSVINLQYFLNGDKKFADDKFSFKYVLGGALRQSRSKETSVGGNNLVVPYLYNVAVRSGEPSLGTNGNFQSRIVSGYGSLGFGYKSMAFVEFTGRNDWDSRLAANNRSFFYPGVNASFILSEAIPSLKSETAISYAKIRAAYTKSGNVNLGVYALQPTYGPFGGFPYGNTAGFTANNTVPSLDLKPEFVTNAEVGAEVGLFKNRVNLEVSYFDQKSDNQILNVSQSWTTGYPTQIANAASFKNYGVEMDLGLTPLIKIHNGHFDLRINATYNDNKILSTLGNVPVVVGGTSGFTQISASSPTANNIAIVGNPAFQFQLTDYARDPMGRVIVDPVTGMPSQAADMIVKGRTLPLWIVGVTPSFTYGNFSISMTWDYKTGHSFYSGMGSDMDFAGISARSAEYGRKRFVFPNSSYWNGTEYVANTSILVQDGNAGFWTSGPANTQIATNYFASATALRLRELNLTYTLPNKLIERIKALKSVSFSVIGKNLLLFVPKSNQWGDPEFNYSSGNNTYGLSSTFQSPASRLIGGSINVQF